VTKLYHFLIFFLYTWLKIDLQCLTNSFSNVLRVLNLRSNVSMKPQIRPNWICVFCDYEHTSDCQLFLLSVSLVILAVSGPMCSQDVIDRKEAQEELCHTNFDRFLSHSPHHLHRGHLRNHPQIDSYGFQCEGCHSMQDVPTVPTHWSSRTFI
jgi:hypothetical protein